MNKQEIYKWLDKNIECCTRYVKLLQNKVDNYDKVPQGPLDPFEEQPKEFYIESLNDYKNTLNINQQIKTELEAWENKETPKKVIAEWHAGYDPQLYYPKSFHCPSCSRRLRGNQSYKYCPKCGQALDWIYI